MRNLTLLVAFLLALPALAAVKVDTVTYKQGDVELEGFMVYDDAAQGKRPGVLIVHDWMGNGEFSKKRAEELAAMGYVAFACDIYGKGVRPKDRTEASAQAGKFKSDRALLRARVNAGLEVLKKNPNVDGARTAAMGYCFGGTTVLELARSGAEVAGVVSFHGGLSTPTPEDAKNIKAKVLVLHGADDPFVKPEEVLAFEDEMRKAGVDWQLVSYGGSVHSFTNPAAGNDNSKGAAYNEKANRRSWEDMKDFFNEIFAAK
ncbi:MAG TPA: dienelactone hydrolase family protein [Planctomycetota bacterium]|nr:dienelactone hydrolase family protein [Planctomycetota bacterium]